MKNTGKECAMLYREFCEWCDTVPYLELDPRLHTHSGCIEDGGYISNVVTAKAFSAWKAARCAPAAPQPQADALDAERWGSEPVTGTPFLQEEDQHLLDRFIETTEDNEGFDIGKEAIKRLANLGVVESLGFGRYGVTVFGYWVHEHYWYQNPSLPLKTNLDRDADARAAIAKATGRADSGQGAKGGE